MIRVVLVDDQMLVRSGIRGLLELSGDIHVVAEAANGREAIERYGPHRPDVTLMDVLMPEVNGIDAMTAIRKEYSDARVVILTAHRGDVHTLRAIKAGAQGYMLKSSLRKDLLQTIRAAHSGQRRITPDVAIELAQHVGREAPSEREVGVLRLMASGNGNKRIAALLGISAETVKTHVRSILIKLGAKDRTHAVTIALKRGIIEI